jgi:hypothetical protein
MTTLTCNEFRAMAAEVALGILSGAERADALGHMEHCVNCRAMVEGLAQTADSLLLLAPEADPSMGFESRVASRVSEQASRRDLPPDVRVPAKDSELLRLGAHASPQPFRPEPAGGRAQSHRRRTALAVTAAAIALVGGTAAAVTVIDHHGSSGTTEMADQTSLRSGQFRADDGRPVGQVYAYNGNPSWVFMNVDASGASGTFTCELQLANGSTVPVGQLDVHDGVGEWAHTVGVDVGHVKAAKLVTPSGLTLATARVS